MTTNAETASAQRVSELGAPISDGGEVSGSSASSSVGTSPTRTRMIEAALATIDDVGLYRASSNESARRAGLTWGVIQRQFGSREAMLLAAFESEWEKPIEMAHSPITGDTIEERIRSFHRILRDHYSRSEYYTGIQIVSNLRKDPKTSAAALELIETMTTRSAGFLTGLRERVLPDHPNGPELTSLIFFAIRDFHIGTHVEAAMNLAEVYERRRADRAAEEEVLVAGLVDIARRQSDTPQENR